MHDPRKIRNIAIIAHVDHGKTTLVDALLKHSGLFRDNEDLPEQMLDSNDLERERGITILAKNTAINYGDYLINIVDTPGHADFGGEVERVLNMVDGVLLVVDAWEGPMPQTRFVLKKALASGLKPIVLINKVDRNLSRPDIAYDQVLDLFLDLGADEQQLEFPIIYGSARDGIFYPDYELKPSEATDAGILLDAITEHIPAPQVDRDGPLQMLVANIDFDSYVGRLAIGRITRGELKTGSNLAVVREGSPEVRQTRVAKAMVYSGLMQQEVNTAGAGEIVLLAGIDGVEIGDTLVDPEHPEPLPFTDIDEPTMALTIWVNNSPFAGREGKYLTSRQILARLEREIEKNLAMKLEEGKATDHFILKGRGELHLSILVEEMRREGYEFQLSRPEIILKEIDGVLSEPEELLYVDCPENKTGVVIEKLAGRKAELQKMESSERGIVRMVFRIPSRFLFAYRSEFLSDTRGQGVLNSVLDRYVPYRGDSPKRNKQVLVAAETGVATAYALSHAEARGQLMITAGTQVYEGMIVGVTQRGEDVSVNVCKQKQKTNFRAAGVDDAPNLSPPIQMTLESALEFIDEDELIEVTPENIRLRKKILNSGERIKQQKRKHSS
ncbi:MAG: translational GTPase TypA [Eubacteriales bacterium]|nr:translational GTPase TypA [Eubacteriales bacterium]